MQKISTLLFIIISNTMLLSTYYPKNTITNLYLNKYNENKWVDSVYNSLTIDERIAQLMFIQVYSNKDTQYYNEISNLIKNYNIGGLTFFQGGPVMQAILTNKWQQEAKTPLLVSIDGEWGLNMRLKDSVPSLPKQMTLGAIQNDSLIYLMAAEIAKQCKRIGIQINFAPVLDINSNPFNPVINNRSFGENKINVAKKGIMFIKGLQDNGVLATGKHFPGHGDTKQDSHKTLPIIYHNKTTIDTFDIYPFKEAIKIGLNAIMVAHLFIPDIDTNKIACSLSPIIIKQILIKNIGFDGLIMTDALNMKGVSDYYPPGELEVKALLAGNDILLLPSNVPLSIKYIKQAINNKILNQEDIEKSCKKILSYKYKLGLYDWKPINIKNIYDDLNNNSIKTINRKLYQSAITLVKNTNNIIPIKKLDTLKIASVSLGTEKLTTFQQTMSNYANINHFNLNKNANTKEIKNLIEKLNNYNLIIIGLHNTNDKTSENYGITNEQISFINNLKKNKKIILDIFANPYSLSLFKDTSSIEAIIVSYENINYAEDASAQIIFGGMPVTGKLPVSTPLFKAGHGITINNII
ncbi:MAG TPA: glycoside hydrolase family 3 protein, partial [Bacteroidales bacterium]|nr:glycoside hydrolase family 3 protein [Bacteroidales bacterium]